MATRSLTVFNNNEGKEIAVMYKHWDGNPDTYGKELITFIGSKKAVNGLSGNSKEVFNGIECLFAQVIAKFKTIPGGIYIYPPGTRNIGEEYIYTIEKSKSGKAVVFIKDVLEEKE